MYVVQQSDDGVWTVGYYTPAYTWVPESDHSTSDEAVERMRYLNGAPAPGKPTRAKPPTPATPPAPKK
jgi:hypothetical protein